MESDIDLSVVLVNWNTREMLRECLDSLREHAPTGRTMEVILVDDGSTDGSAEMAELLYPEVVLIRHEEKRGFTPSNNEGLRAAKGRLLLALNTDTIVHAEALDRICDLIEARPDIGLLSARLFNTDGTLQAHYGRLWTTSLALAWSWYLHHVPLLRPLLTGRPETEPAGQTCDDPDCPHQILYPEFTLGACHLLRREVYERVGEQDETINTWAGDVDWCLRAAKSGYRQAILTCSHITHHLGGTIRKDVSGKLYREKLWGQYQAYVQIIRKHEGNGKAFWLKVGIALFGVSALMALTPFLLVPPTHRRARRAADKYATMLVRLPHF